MFSNKQALALYTEYTAHLNLHGSAKMEKAAAAATRFIKDHCPSGDHKAIQMKFNRLVQNKPAS